MVQGGRATGGALRADLRAAASADRGGVARPCRGDGDDRRSSPREDAPPLLDRVLLCRRRKRASRRTLPGAGRLPGPTWRRGVPPRGLHRTAGHRLRCQRVSGAHRLRSTLQERDRDADREGWSGRRRPRRRFRNRGRVHRGGRSSASPDPRSPCAVPLGRRTMRVWDPPPERLCRGHLLARRAAAARFGRRG